MGHWRGIFRSQLKIPVVLDSNIDGTFLVLEERNFGGDSIELAKRLC